ncbi:Alpha-1,2-mannosidase [Cystobacter fuscus DSM 2262]|uniref:Alpha-1,2-mannosidase n=1 Tax=Cystobacter fuscus (strain ATCC 25194 / DSM 2262 / NBRC 100088 / M29) TaxID=1242864 RepID=S9P5G6_CYSF2|nr:Alpha-1,2-mannosidase [Cystobacter fuscus DSM 2262]
MGGRVKARHGVFLLLGLCCALTTGPVQAFDEAASSRISQVARRKLARTAEEVPVGQYPKSSRPDGTWLLVPADNMIGWTQGFFPGELWLMYDQSGEPDWRTRAETWTRPLEVQQDNVQTHDLGFKFLPSYGLAYRLTDDDYYRQVLLRAAGSLATRYNPQVGIISCCDWNPDWHLPLVIDTMMNLELLLWASRNGGQPGWRDMAITHALRTQADLVRPDGSTYHVVDYDPDTGARRFRGTYQGYSDTSTWARGHAWSLYGFTLLYRYTRDPRMLETAQRVTDYYLGRLPEDAVPNWDLDAPTPQKDSSAAAIIASALLELSNYVPDADKKVAYWNAALRMLDSLSSPAYLDTADTSPGLLLHGVGNFPAGQEVDVSLVYGDYYFLEAVRRFQRQTRPPLPSDWYSRLDFAAATHTLGGGNTGVLVAEFDVTPLDQPLDAVIGYADSATSVTAFSQLSMLIRMNTSGFFDVRNGAAYAATHPVPYESLSTYHVRMVTDLGAGQYSVWVTPPGGAEILLADRFAFRTGAPPIDDLGQVVLESGAVDEEYRVSGHTVSGVWSSQPGFAAGTRALGGGNTGVLVAEFDVTPRTRPLDGVIGYADSSALVTSRAALALSLRLSPAGVFDAYDGTRYAATNAVPYEANATYHVRIVADLPAGRYSIWLEPPSGPEVLLADRFAFRAGAPLTDDLGQLTLKSTTAGEFQISGHTLGPAPGARPAE